MELRSLDIEPELVIENKPDFTEYENRIKMLEYEWRAIELRGWITKNGRHILIGDDDGGSSRIGAGGGIPRLYSNGGIKPKKKVDKAEKSDIIDFEANRKELKQSIADGKLSTKLDKKAQSAHKKGSEEYNKRIEKGGLPSYTELSNMEVQKIINTHSLTGEVHKGKDGQFREVLTLKEKNRNVWW